MSVAACKFIQSLIAKRAPKLSNIEYYRQRGTFLLHLLLSTRDCLHSEHPENEDKLKKLTDSEKLEPFDLAVGFVSILVAHLVFRTNRVSYIYEPTLSVLMFAVKVHDDHKDAQEKKWGLVIMTIHEDFLFACLLTSMACS